MIIGRHFASNLQTKRTSCRIAAARLALDEMVNITNKMKDHIERVKKLATGENLNKLKRKEQATELAAFHLRWTGKSSIFPLQMMVKKKKTLADGISVFLFLLLYREFFRAHWN